MSVEIIGIIGLLAGLPAFWLGPAVALPATAVLALLGAAAAFKLPAMGNASILVGHLVLVFLVASVMVRRRHRDAALRSLAFPGPGFILLLFVAYAVLTAAFLPRIFAGATEVYSLARGEESGARIVVAGLAPRASNLTQAGYLVANLLCFAAAAAFIRLHGQAGMTRILLLVAALNLGFALLDVATFATGTAELLSVIRNASYGLLEDGEIAGLKRIVGSFPEASTYGYVTIGLFAFAARLWLGGVEPRRTGWLAFLLGATLVLSTSTTAYAALCILAILILAGCLARLLRGEAGPRDLRALTVVPCLAAAVILGAALLPGVWSIVLEALDRTVLSKLDSMSGVERSRWNAQAMQSVLDTYGIGAGVGSVRASSYIVALLACTGIAGTLLFLAFMAALAAAPRGGAGRSKAPPVRESARLACVAMFVSASVSAGGTDLGLLFFLFAALAVTPAGIARPPAPARRPGGILPLRSSPSIAGVPA